MGRRTSRQPTGLGQALEQARDAMNMTQQEAAAIAGFSSGTWSNVIFGGQRLKVGSVVTMRRIRVSDDNVRAAAAAVGLDVGHALALDREAVTEETSPDTNGNYNLADIPTGVLLAEVQRRYA